MFVEVAFESKGFAAPLTNVRFAGRMSLDVGSEIGLVGKGFAANVALERLFTCGTTRWLLISFLVTMS